MQRPGGWERFDAIGIDEAAQALEGVVEHTPLVRFDTGDPRIDLRLKLENRQKTGSFKARGAWNQVRQLDDAERAAGVVACSSGNHGGALAWAAERAGVLATICMPDNAYPNKVEACRARGARIVLSPTREAAEEACAALVAGGCKLVHPYDDARTVAGAGTVGLEIAREWPEVEVAIFPVGGGGLVGGGSLAMRRRLGPDVCILGVEPAGAPTMQRGLAAREPVVLAHDTEVQGLCPLYSGHLNIEICSCTLDDVLTLEDELIFAAQAALVARGEVVEPAGAAAPALVLSGRLPAALLEGRGAADPLRVVAVVSGGNPDPAQLRALQGSA